MGKHIVIKQAHAGTQEMHDREVTTHMELQGHPHYLEVLDTIERDEGLPLIVMPWCKKGSLSKYGNKNREMTGMPYTSIIVLVRQLMQAAKGLEHMHSLNVVHCDLKEDSILVELDESVKVADFGLSVEEGTRIKGIHGSLPYIAPEILDAYLEAAKSGQPFSYEARPWHDVWGMGVMAFAALSPKPMHWLRLLDLEDLEDLLDLEDFLDLSPEDQTNMLQHEARRYHLDLLGLGVHRVGLEVDPSDWVMLTLLRILQGCLRENPEERTTATELQAQLQTLLWCAEAAGQVRASLPLSPVLV